MLWEMTFTSREKPQDVVTFSPGSPRDFYYWTSACILNSREDWESCRSDFDLLRLRSLSSWRQGTALDTEGEYFASLERQALLRTVIAPITSGLLLEYKYLELHLYILHPRSCRTNFIITTLTCYQLGEAVFSWIHPKPLSTTILDIKPSKMASYDTHFAALNHFESAAPSISRSAWLDIPNEKTNRPRSRALAVSLRGKTMHVPNLESMYEGWPMEKMNSMYAELQSMLETKMAG